MLAARGLLLAGCGDAPARKYAEHTPQRIAHGQKLLTQYQCGSCHAIPGVAASRGITGPSLEAFGRRSYIAGQIPNRPEALARWIVQPRSVVPGTTMPAMGASLHDAQAMAAYLHSLQ